MYQLEGLAEQEERNLHLNNRHANLTENMLDTMSHQPVLFGVSSGMTSTLTLTWLIPNPLSAAQV